MTDKIVVELKKKSENELQKYQYLGAEIKNSRLKLSKTLESMINVSKSVSYISKVENNKIIPNQACLEELCDELLINKSSLSTLENFEESLEEAIEGVFYNDINKLTLLFEQYSCFSNVRTDLMKGLYYFLTEDHKHLKEIVFNLSKVESSLILSDYLIYVLLSVKDLIIKKEMIAAFNIIKVIKASNKASKYLKMIFEKLEFELLLTFSISNNESEYQKIIFNLLTNLNENETILLNKKYLRYKIELGNEEYLLSLLKNITDDELKFLILCKLDRLENLVLNNEFSTDIKILYYFKVKDIKNLDNLIAQYKLSEEDLIKINYYKLKLSNSIEDLREYITNISIPYYLSVCNVNQLLLLLNEVIELNSKISKYKETTIIAKKIMTLIKDIIILTN